MQAPITPPAVRGILFDLDGTLYQPPVLFKTRLTLTMPGGITYLRRLKAARERVSGTVYASQELLLDAFYSQLADLSGNKKEQARDWYQRRFLPGLITFMRRRCYARPGLLPLLADLRRRGIKLAVVSDIGVVPERLAALDIPPEAFDLAASTEESGALKPSPKGFEDAVRALGLEVDEVLIVGDRDDRDGAAARGAGIPFLHLLSGSRADQPDAMPWPEARASLGSLRPD